MSTQTPTIMTVYGEATEEQFKEIYGPIYAAVKDREHLASGYVAHTVDLGAMGKIEVRTLKRKERVFIQNHAPLDSNDSAFNETLAIFNDLTLIFAFVGCDADTFLYTLGTDISSYADLLKIPLVQQKLEYVNDLPDLVVNRIGALITDVNVAFDKALMEQVVNPLKPASGQ